MASSPSASPKPRRLSVAPVNFGALEESDGSSSSGAESDHPSALAAVSVARQKSRRRSSIQGGRGRSGRDVQDLDEDDVANNWGAESVDGGEKLSRYLTYHATGGAMLAPGVPSFATRHKSFTGGIAASLHNQSMWGIPSEGEAEESKARRRSINGAVEATYCCGISKPTSYVPPALRHRSLIFGIYGNNPVRLLVHDLVTSRGFEGLVLLVILANCVFLALDDPREDDSVKPAWNFYLDLGFAGFYTLEMLLKVFALGFVRHRGSYLKDAWNRLDAVIVVVTWLAFLPGVGNYSALRVLRVLRPLRSMNAIKGLKTLVIALLRSFESLWPVLVLGAIVFSIFAVVATQLWAGMLRNVCVPQISNGTIGAFVPDEKRYFSIVPRMPSSLFTERCRIDAGDFDEWLGRKCPPGFKCVENLDNPGLGTVSFDHAGWSLLTIFQVATFEGWPAVLRATAEVNGPGVFFFYFVVLLIGAYFVPNLALAVINDRYHTAIRKQREYDARVAAAVANNKQREERERQIENKVTQKLQINRVTSQGQLRSSRTTSFVAVQPSGGGDMDTTYTTSGDFNRTGGGGTPDDEIDTSGPSCWLSFRNVLHRVTQGFPLPEYTISVAAANHKSSLSLKELDDAEEDDPTRDDDGYFLEEEGDDHATAARKRREHQQLASHRRRMTVFTAFIILCILLNTVVLAAQHHNQPKWMDEWTDRANLAFLGIFALELLIVLVAVGFRRFLTSGFFVLDLLVVIASIIELFAVGSAILTVFRTLRLLRPLKLIRNAPSLKAVVSVMIDAVRETVYVNMVLFLLILIFALGGMQFFGGDLAAVEIEIGNGTASQPPVEVRAKFDTFLAAFLTVFQVITTDNWTNIMWQSMRATHPAAAIYFVVLVLVGFYVVVNLFLSILITGFEREAERTHRERNGDESSDGDDDDEEHERRAKVDEVHAKLQTKLAGPAPDAFNATSGSNHHPGAGAGHDENVTVLFRDAREEKDLEADERRRQMAPVLKTLFKSFGKVPETALSLALQAQSASIERSFQAMPLTRYTCWRCDYNKQKVLSAPPFVQKMSVHDVHDRQCAMARIRRVREEFLLNLIAIVHEQMAENSMLTPEMSAALLVNGKKAKCFSTLEVADLRSWRDIRDEAKEELDVIRLAVGEEQLGRAHVSYVYQGLRLRQMTNGSTSLFLFGPENPFRAWLTATTQHTAFDAFIFVMISLSTILIIIDNPRTTFDDDTTMYMNYADFAFSIIFAIEIVMRVIALGLVLHPNSYLRSGWHWLDVVSVAISFATSFGAIKALRTLRFLRPLRTIKRYRGLRLVVSTIVTSIKGITHVVLLSLVSYLIFGILAVQLFAGKLYECNDPTVTTIYNCVGFFNATANVLDEATNTFVPTPFAVERRWEKFTRNFDHIGSSILTLFQVSTGDDWADVMYSAIDAKSTTEAPVRDNQPLMGLFFVVFYGVSSFFFVNLFVGVVIVNFSKVKQKADGVAFLTPAQREWVDSQRAILQMRPEPLLLPADAGAFRRAMDRFVRSARFELFIALCITANVVIIAMEYEGMDELYALVLTYASWGFAGLFFVEMLLKLAAHGVRYFYLGWNRFDAFLAVLGVVSLVFELVSEVDNYVPFNVAVLRALRFIRVLRVLRLFKKARRVRVLVETLWHSLPSIANISLLLFILYIVFAVVGVQLFANVKSGGRFLDDDMYNFRDFVRALQLLFIFTTNEKWSDAMYDLMEDTPYCDPDLQPDSDCGFLFAPAFFVPLIIIGSLVATNLFLAIILDNFATTMNLDQSRVTLADLHRFMDVWATFDPDASNMIPTRCLPKLLAALQPPLGTTRANSRVELLQLMTQYRILDHDGRVHFAEVVVPLARQAISQGGASLRGLDIAAWGFAELDDLPTTWYEHRPAHSGHTMAATYIAACFRRHRQREWFLERSRVRAAAQPSLAPRQRSQRRSIALAMEDF